jgi:hypothetical protein
MSNIKQYYDDEVLYTWDRLVDADYFTDAELRLITYINGYTIDTLNDCIYARYGYRSLKQMEESEL